MVIDLELFKQRLVETVLWCRHQLRDDKYVENLRKIRSEPVDLDAPSTRQAIVLKEFSSRVFEKRHDWYLSNYAFSIPITDVDLQDGMVIVVIIDYILAWDGVAQRNSSGYFDFNGYPAWDSWIYYITANQMEEYGLERTHNLIISWVPDEFSAGVRLAILETPDASILTLEQAAEEFSYLKPIQKLIK